MNIPNIQGLEYYPDFITIEEQESLINHIDNSEWLSDLKRKVQHYGYKYDYRARMIDESFKIGELPDWSLPLLERMKSNGIINFEFDQLIINNYEVGQGIAMHIDCKPCFEDTIVSLSLLSDITMDLKSDRGYEKHSITLEQRSLLKLSDDARYSWLHGITPRKSDTINETRKPRERRVSLTFRKVFL